MKYIHRAKLLLHKLSAYRVSLYAANASFYIVLSLFPAVMLLVSILPYIGYSNADLLDAFLGVVPQVFEPLLSRMIEDMSTNGTAALISITAIIAVWSSSRGVYCIQQGINGIYRTRENRSYLIRRLLCMLYMVLLLIALVLTLVIHGFGQEFAAFCERQAVPVLHLIASLLRFRELIVLAVLTVIFSFMFSAFPNKKIRFRSAFPGAALAALGWLVFTYGFSLYIRVFGDYSVLYGSLSIIAVGMLWLYICISILFYGCVFNHWLEKRKLSE